MSGAGARFVLGSLVFASIAGGCSHRIGGGDDDGDDGVAGGIDAARPGAADAAIPDAGATPSPWVELTDPVVDVTGGTALAPDGHGRDGGMIHLSAAGAITIDPKLSAPLMAAMPPAPAGAAMLTDDDLAHDVTEAGTIGVSGSIQASGSDPVRVITSTSGDIVIDGQLRAADLGGATQSLALHAPAGTVYVTGLIDTAGPDGTEDGDAAGAIEITARSVVISGHLVAAGETGDAGPGGHGGALRIVGTDGDVLIEEGSLTSAGGPSVLQGGDGGALEISAAGQVGLAAAIDTLGGDARGDTQIGGGAGGAIHVVAGADLQLSAPLRLRGGAASALGAGAAGGAAGALSLDAGGVVRIDAIIDDRGGLASADAAGAAVTGGAAGSVLIGAQRPPAAIEIRNPMVAIGGAGVAAGGAGGDVALGAAGGDLTLAGLIQVDGGGSLQLPGNAGVLQGTAGPGGGGIVLAGPISGIGGAAMPGGVADGGTGARLRLEAHTLKGDLQVSTTGALWLDGGAASGAGHGGAGGDITMVTLDGNASMAGQLIARGGAAMDGGTGGQGGILDLFTDADFDGIGGNLTIEVTGLIDVSGGVGATGGSARNNGALGVALFPAHQELIAVLLNSDGVHGGPQDGALVNLGHIVARGGASNGWGGDIMFHGRQPGIDEDPLPGNLSLEGDGDGHDGDYVAE